MNDYDKFATIRKFKEYSHLPISVTVTIDEEVRAGLTDFVQTNSELQVLLCLIEECLLVLNDSMANQLEEEDTLAIDDDELHVKNVTKMNNAQYKELLARSHLNCMY